MHGQTFLTLIFLKNLRARVKVRAVTFIEVRIRHRMAITSTAVVSDVGVNFHGKHLKRWQLGNDKSERKMPTMTLVEVDIRRRMASLRILYSTTLT